MIKFLYIFLCKLGLHKKETITRAGEVNWITMYIKVERCKHCKKQLKIL